jgi:hypothetical protein
MASTPSIKRLRTLALPSLLLAAGGAGAYLRGRFQKSQVFSPQRYPNGVWQPAEFGVPAEDVFFETDDGVKLHAWWVPRKKARGTVLYCHGNSGNITNRIDAFAQFGRLHMNVFAFDYRGYGRSEGEPSEDGLFRDVRAAYDEVTGPLSQHPESVVLFGHSLGGAVAIDAALHRDVAGVVIQSSFTQIRDMARTVMPWGPLGLIARNEFRSIAKVGLIEVPKLFIHGADDPTVPLEMGRRLFEAAAEPKEWHEIARAGHNDVYRQGGLRYFWRLQRFFRKCLK